MKNLKKFSLIFALLLSFNAMAEEASDDIVDNEDEVVTESASEDIEASTETPAPNGGGDQSSAPTQGEIIRFIMGQLMAANIQCTPRLNLVSNVLFRAWRGEMRVGYACTQNDQNRKLSGSVLIKKCKIRGCTEANQAALRARINFPPIKTECKTNRRGQEFFEALYVRKLEIKLKFF